MSVSHVVTLFTVSALVVSACAAYAPGQSSQLQRNVHVLGKADVSNSMQLMGRHLFNLTSITMTSNPENNPENQTLNRDVLRELRTIKDISKGLGGSDQTTNYSVINRYMGSFIYDVQIAEEFAALSPPNYVPANRLIKSCLSCHESF